MVKWNDSITARCRGAEEFAATLNDAEIFFEDSEVGERGFVFCVGALGSRYFHLSWYYTPDSPIVKHQKSFGTQNSLNLWFEKLLTDQHSLAQEVILSFQKYLTEKI